MAFIATRTLSGTKLKPVKNLGWLLRHWQEVNQLGFNYGPDSNDGTLVAKMKNGDAYFCDYASLMVCWRFLDRPVFRGIAFTLCFADFTRNSQFIVGDDKWKQIAKLEYAQFMSYLIL
jgi:hypothetical protein